MNVGVFFRHALPPMFVRSGWLFYAFSHCVSKERSIGKQDANKSLFLNIEQRRQKSTREDRFLKKLMQVPAYNGNMKEVFSNHNFLMPRVWFIIKGKTYLRNKYFPKGSLGTSLHTEVSIFGGKISLFYQTVNQMAKKW